MYVINIFSLVDLAGRLFSCIFSWVSMNDMRHFLPVYIFPAYDVIAAIALEYYC
jgi:hypothetical protein